MASSSSSSSIGYAEPIAPLHPVRSFINLEPITKKGIVHYNPRMIHIYQTKRGNEPRFVAVAANAVGVAIKTPYEKESTHPDRSPSCYLGRIGSLRGVLANHSGTLNKQNQF